MVVGEALTGRRQDTYVAFCVVSSSACQWLSMARCTMGSCRPWNQITGMSPTSMTLLRFQIRQTSPRWKAGDMDSDTTTMIGCVESVASDNAFHAMKTPATAKRQGRRAAALARIAVMSMGEEGWRISNVPQKPIGKRTQLISCQIHPNIPSGPHGEQKVGRATFLTSRCQDMTG